MKAADWSGVTGDAWAEEWRRTDLSFGPVNDALVAASIDALAGGSAARILEVGCGAGTTAFALADALRPARITGIDLSPALIDVARDRAGSRSDCVFHVGDAARWADDGDFDLVVSRHGVMFFDDPVAALAHIRSLAKPGAPLRFSCFRSPALNPWASGIARLLPSPASPPDPDAPGPFAFADDQRVRGLLAAAGWSDIVATPLDYDYVAGSGADPVADALNFFGRIGPSAAALRELRGDAQRRFQAGLAALVEAHHGGGRVVFPAAAWIWSARA